MRKISFVLALILALGCVLTSCARTYKAYKIDPNYVPQNNSSTTNTVTALDGVTRITLPKEISNIVCFSPEAATIIRGVGGSRAIKAIDSATENAVSGKTTITVDDIAAQDPDLVFISETYDPASVDSLRDIPYITIPSIMTINDIKNLITIIETALNSNKDSLNDAIDKQMSIAQQATSEYANKYPTFVDLGDYNTAGGGNYVNEAISVSGGENVFGDKEGFFKVTKEQIIAANPYFIFTTSDVKTYRTDRDLKQLDAVKEGRVVQIESYKIVFASHTISDVINTMFNEISTARDAAAGN